MIHIRVIENELYERIKNGTVDILTEIPSYDGKRRQIKAGDKISFINQLTHKRLVADCLEITYSPVEEICDIKVSNPKTEVLFPALVEEYELKYVLIIAIVDNTKIILSRHKDRTSWDIPGGHIERGETAKEAAIRELYEETGVTENEIQEMYRLADYHACDINSDSKGAFCRIFIAHIKHLPDSPPAEFEMVETITYDFASDNNLKDFDKSIVLTHKDIYTILLSIISRMLHYYDLDYRGEDIEIIEECTNFNKEILSYTPEILMDFSLIDNDSIEHLLLNGDVNMFDVAEAIEFNEHNYNVIKYVLGNYNVFELECWVEEFNQKRLDKESSFFTGYMLFPQTRDEEFLLRLRNEDQFLLEKEFASYSELFEYINRTKTREELSILLPNGYEDATWCVSKFDGDNIIADWKLTIEGNLIPGWIVSNGISFFSNYDIGDVLTTHENNVFLIYLGKCYENMHFIRVEYTNDNIKVDMEYLSVSRALLHVRDIPELICGISDLIKNNPHQYYRWLFYWKAYSKCGKEEQNKNMLYIIERDVN